MLERERMMQELWRRLASVEGVVYTARNPKAEPGVKNLPAIQFFGSNMASCERGDALRRNVDAKRNSERATRVWGVTSAALQREKCGHDTPKRELRSAGLAV